MISRWRLANFKSVYDKVELDLKPLTIFAGANSSGKSTFIQSMLLVAQTLSNQLYDRPVILNGQIIRLGTFDDLASSDSGKSEINIGFKLSYDKKDILYRPSVYESHLYRRSPFYYYSGIDLDFVECDFTFSSDDVSVPREISQLQPGLNSCKIILKESEEEDISSVEITKKPLPPKRADARFPLTDKFGQSIEPVDLEYMVSAPK